MIRLLPITFSQLPLVSPCRARAPYFPQLISNERTSGCKMSTDGAYALEHGGRFSRVRLRSNSYDQAMTVDENQATRAVAKSLPSPRKASEFTYQDDDIHLIKWIEFHHERLPILLQNINGPCPLLAVANVLLLTRRVKLLHGC